jgi:hypothetical protein
MYSPTQTNAGPTRANTANPVGGFFIGTPLFVVALSINLFSVMLNVFRQ